MTNPEDYKWICSPAKKFIRSFNIPGPIEHPMKVSFKQALGVIIDCEEVYEIDGNHNLYLLNKENYNKKLHDCPYTPPRERKDTVNVNDLLKKIKEGTDSIINMEDNKLPEIPIMGFVPTKEPGTDEVKSDMSSVDNSNINSSETEQEGSVNNDIIIDDSSTEVIESTTDTVKVDTSTKPDSNVDRNRHKGNSNRR